MNGNPARKIERIKQLAASQTDAEITEAIYVTAGGALNCRVNISTTVTAGQIIYKLQQKVNDTWVDIASTNATDTVTATGTSSLKMSIHISGDQADMPLSNAIRVIGTTNGSWDGSIDEIRIVQAE